MISLWVTRKPFAPASAPGAHPRPAITPITRQRAVLSLHEIFGATGRCSRNGTFWMRTNRGRHRRTRRAALRHAKNAYCTDRSSRSRKRGLSRPTRTPRHAGIVGRARRMVWALENPDQGIVEADETDFAAARNPDAYLGPVKGFYTD